MSAKTGLIGYTGFVGSTLMRSRAFDARYNSSNIEEIRGRHFSTLVCAGVSAVKWLANKEPEQDKAGIIRLTDPLETVTADHFVLVSTVDVYPAPVAVTEADQPDPASAQPYGRHRRELELWAQARFKRCTIVRLPGLFGEGLKKNPIYDLIVGNQVDKIVPNGVLQWYPMRRFAEDLDKVVASGHEVINVAVEPIETAAIVDMFFPGTAIGAPSPAAPRYDMRTLHAPLLGGEGDYHIDRATMLGELKRFIEGARA
ncbi:hypothetical protein BJF92_07275 [Rhizobium rhizosphaerae]|uniref:NAD(P)-dependent oxidoreductase n=1 Tax=Xaviernesmea rhizosphaerae TaxID=1672749 RepID=A0A1Q9ACZ2_9HYPH|nr:hypothetical protein [Xaviernesmea rhizosphaerae]OLP52780.1 hypothetical protein BJF92_07275 [Xaviernesmea rhizosphaerae]